MKKIILALATLAIAFTACNKAEDTNTTSPYSNVKVHLTVTAPEANLTKANFAWTDPSNPIGGLNVTWKEGDYFELIIFQGNNADWKDNYIHKTFSLPAGAEGQTSYDLSSLVGSVDLSSFDDTKNLKYVVVYEGFNHFNEYWHELNIWNGVPNYSYTLSPSEQINRTMFAETNVQEIAFPSGDLTLSGKLYWMTSVLAVQFDIDPAADISYPSDSYFICDLTHPSIDQVDCYFPITRKSDASTKTISLPIVFNGGGTLSDALDGNKCRYFAIPSDSILDAAGNTRKLGGANVSFRLSGPAKDFTSSGSLSDVAIEPGMVYGIKVKVTDSDSNGEPEFTKL